MTAVPQSAGSLAPSPAKITLLGLQADAFRHPLDRAATLALKQLPGFDLVIRNLLAPTAEEYFYLDNIASGILVGDRQLPHLHALLQEAAKILDLDAPQLYIRQNPVPNAYTFAMRGKRPFMVIHTSLLDLLTPAEIQAVMAHELGHLKCDHGVYLTLANLLILAAEQIPAWGLSLAQNLQEQLMEWVRCAEFTCDRAALLVSQDPRIVASVLMKLTGGSPQLAAQLNLDAFIAQAKAYEASTATDLGQLMRQMQTAPRSHPLPVLRAWEIDRWGSSPEYHKLLQSAKSGYNSKAKSTGGWRNW
ncbi:MAG: M48 family metallopeptidase [Prochlorothrix sp.]|nr:M48 family metallopeptidase [Prochlorothrix sp.]